MESSDEYLDGNSLVSSRSDDDYIGGNDESSFGNETHATGSPIIGHDETRLVWSSKALVFLFLIITASIGAFLTFRFLQNEDAEALAKEFEVEAKEVLAVSTLNAQQIFNLFEAEALQLTTHAISSRQEWPFFTFPFFESEASLLLEQTNIKSYIALHPLVEWSKRIDWEVYSTQNQDWIGNTSTQDEAKPTICPVISSSIWNCDEAAGDEDIYAPLWQIAPTSDRNQELINFNGFESPFFSRKFDLLYGAKSSILSEVTNLDEGDVDEIMWPESILSTPVHETVNRTSPIVAVLTAVVRWDNYFKDVLPEEADGIVVVVDSEKSIFTFEINGPQVTYLGPGDLHDREYDDLEINSDFAGFGDGKGNFGYTVHVCPTDQFRDEHTTNKPITYTIAVVMIFVFTASVFLFYDFMVERRQHKVVTSAEKSRAIINSLFPANVRGRLMDQAKEPVRQSPFGMLGLTPLEKPENLQSKTPIADFFTEATVMFADISGFTAWSSAREPSQVFYLLESIYNMFDRIARKMKVFKVETIGDSYVAVAGLPDPRQDHAVVMARFAHRCLFRMTALVQKLELSLGPGTGDLRMRFGLNSGPVTAGVLRGEKSRFQLFGDTVNTAARMESTGMRSKIQMTKATQELLVQAGKADWTVPREELVEAKGKGQLQTYWLSMRNRSESVASSADEEISISENYDVSLTEKAGQISKEVPMPSSEHKSTRRLVLWNVENLMIALKRVVATRSQKKPVDEEAWRKLQVFTKEGMSILDEAEEYIELPTEIPGMIGEDQIEIDEKVFNQLVHLVTTIAELHNEHNFHNFAHASHVSQSVAKLLSRVVSPGQSSLDDVDTPTGRRGIQQTLHEYTFGITSDPLTQFAMVFSALVHDVDHPGVPNTTLVDEGNELASTYKNKSVAEQHSFELAWSLLMEPAYEDLRMHIYHTKEELGHFRHLVVNGVMATDVMDKELGKKRKERWELAFQTNSPSELETVESDNQDLNNRKCTIILEHMMQASDVSHTMQHWQIYIEWNQRLFLECQAAYVAGRAKCNPIVNWYDGELKFFDYYVIPLAKNLKDCGVFGVSGDEYLGYATSNREEWARCGQEIVESYVSQNEISQ